MVSTGISFSTARSISGFIPLVMYRVGETAKSEAHIEDFPATILCDES